MGQPVGQVMAKADKNHDVVGPERHGIGQRKEKGAAKYGHDAGRRRQVELLRYFGGIQGIERASVEELARVPGISRKIAEDVYATFHNQ